MSNPNLTKRTNRLRRHARVRAKVSGSAARPRVSLFKSNRSVYAQAIDDQTGKTLAAVNDAAIKKGVKAERARAAGKKLAELLLKKEIQAVVFDTGGFKYHGRVKAVAEGLREGGIKV